MSVREARQAYEQAAKNLLQATKDEYPAGMVVDVKLGAAVVRIQITGHYDSWWSGPGQMRGINVVTGKRRDFYPWNVLAYKDGD